MNPVILQVVAWFLEKALIESGKEADWAGIKSDLQAHLNVGMPGSIYDNMGDYFIGLLIDMIANYFKGTTAPPTPAIIHQWVQDASQTLLGRVAANFLELGK